MMRKVSWGKITGYLFLVAAALIIPSCDDYTLQEQFTTSYPGDLGFLISPGEANLSVGNSIIFLAIGGKPPYTFSIAFGDQSNSIDPVYGVYTAANMPGDAVVRVRDADNAYRDALVTIISNIPLTIDPPEIILNPGSSYSFSAFGGYPDYSFQVYYGEGTLDPPSSGNYTAPGPAGVNALDLIRVSDSRGNTSFAVVRILESGPLALSPENPVTTENNFINFSASGGSYYYTYSVAEDPGMIDTSGRFTADLPGTFTVEVSDYDPQTATFSTTATVIPAAPTNLTASVDPANKKFIDLSWTDNSGGEDSYHIERKEGSGAFVLYADLGPGIQSYKDNNPNNLPNKFYFYRVYAEKAVLKSAYSNEAYAITQ